MKGDIRQRGIRGDVHGVDLEDVLAGFRAVGQRVISIDRQILVGCLYRRLFKVEEGERPSRGR